MIRPVRQAHRGVEAEIASTTKAKEPLMSCTCITLDDPITADHTRRLAHAWALSVIGQSSGGVAPRAERASPPTRPNSAPAYYLGRSAATWQTALGRRRVMA